MVSNGSKLIPIVFLLIIISTNPAFAHKLLAVNDNNTMFQTSTVIPDPFGNSYFTLETFEREGQSHWYAFNGIKGERVLIQTLVPDIESSRDFTPCFDLLIGQDKVTPDPIRKNFLEDITNSNWIITCELDMILPSDGLYYVRAHDELHHYEFGDTGKFSFAIGTMDNLTIFDWMQVPFWILHVNLFFENLVFVWIMLSLLVVVAVIILYMIMRRRD